jgi:hypothetical protein
MSDGTLGFLIEDEHILEGGLPKPFFPLDDSLVEATLYDVRQTIYMKYRGEWLFEDSSTFERTAFFKITNPKVIAFLESKLLVR